MKQLCYSEHLLAVYEEHLKDAEKCKLTIEKYLRDIKIFFQFLGREESVDHAMVIAYKEHLKAKYAPASVNSMLASINGFFKFNECGELCVRPLKIQRTAFLSPEKELTHEEYKRLLDAAKGRQNERLNLVMQTICATGIRVSELEFITAEAVRCRRAMVSCKGKTRIVFIPKQLQKLLNAYLKQNNINSGCVFINRRGKPLSRHRIWADMKSLCADAQVDPKKVFPHNLRHLFARCFYSVDKDLSRLADILGHSNINTTRIYTMECGREHERILSRLSLVYK